MRRKYVKIKTKVTVRVTYDGALPDEDCDKELFFYARVPSTSPAYIERLITTSVWMEEKNMVFGKFKGVAVKDFTVQNAYDARK
jgi:hypothetical protein